jgi:DNA repair photolyase
MPDGMSVGNRIGFRGRLQGRGATLNPAPRYEPRAAEPFDDGWAALGAAFADLPPLPPAAPNPTTLTPDRSRSALTYNTSPDLPFDRSVNPYKGCEHGCIYCYARPIHAYLGLSPGLDFETQIHFKPDIAQQLERELSRPGYVPRPIHLGANTDPYQPVERTLRLTRQVLEVLDRFGHPASIVTKGAGVLRDLDILRRMADRGLIRVWLSVTTLDGALARRMEPRAAAPARRVQAIHALAAAGIPAGVLAAPMIPGLNDAELERILAAARSAGANHAGYVLLRLPHELRELVAAWLHEHFPDRARHVLSLVRETRAGALNDSRFGARMTGVGAYADALARRFAVALRRLGFDDRSPLGTEHFAPPRPAAAMEAQLSLL